MRSTCTLLGIVLVPALLAPVRAEAPAAKKVVLASPITHSDWMLRNPAPKWGPEGIRQILDRAKECGWSRVYWRCFDGGRACYLSKLMEPLHGFDEDNYHRGKGSEALVKTLDAYDWGSFDAFKEAITYGHKIGLEVHAWLSINEDDHGWGLTSRFTRENPDSRWVTRDGRVFRSQQSFAFEKVRAYKLGLVKEILAYRPDGVFFDWIRTGDVRCNPHTDKEGVAIYGYEGPNVERFRAKCGKDPKTVANDDEQWVRIRAEPQTVFMRQAHALIKKTNSKMAISAMVHNPWGYRGRPDDTPYKDNLYGLLLDTRAWADEGLIDEIVAAGYYRSGGNAELAYQAMKKETGGKLPVWLFGWIGSADQFRGDTRLAEKLGAPQLLLWESDYIGLPPANEQTVKAMAEYAKK
ncbi:MAG: family 10 glycosylhydrolase [Phycisphaerae bacterium]|nr:family 10 glycosylhydrolase [Phycisphaerae bacterium]